MSASGSRVRRAPLPIVAIIGRPNVGKSTLFNRIAQRRVAIVEGEPGVTRDRLMLPCRWLDHKFLLVDTGGIEPAPESEIEIGTRRQAEIAIAEADVILFVVDVRSGLTAADYEVAEILRRAAKPVILVANKADGAAGEVSSLEFHALGIGDPVPVSAEHGRNIGDLLDRVVAHFPEMAEDEETDVISVTVLGRPNVGKSSLVNRIIGEDRMIVSDLPGTTRDAIDTEVEHDGQVYRLIDTAGLRRKSRIESDVERYSVLRAIRAAERSDVCLLVLDATEGVTEQDRRIAGIPHEAGKGIVIVVNKWDLIEKDAKTMDRYDEQVRNELAFISYAPSLYISAKTGQRVHTVLDTVRFVAEQGALRVKTGRLNEVIQEAVQMHQPPSRKGRRLKILFAQQVGVQPPHFVLFVNDPELFHFSYQRYIENRLREAFGFAGNPVLISVRRRSD